ncbi:protein of unknown function [Candidatus Nitrospira inopinata]|uniref:Uncharacterized protein n=1 Tax=Candidatus Nitrospira inopinata TaxID=1715989 RepID=A0A0S4KV21_9BACT|nr:protein of unknown function [Candidatus Nitrospira inopinata]
MVEFAADSPPIGRFRQGQTAESALSDPIKRAIDEADCDQVMSRLGVRGLGKLAGGC